MTRKFDDFVVMTNAPASRRIAGDRREAPVVTYRVDSVGGCCWVYNMRENHWRSLDESEDAVLVDCPTADILRPASTVLLIVNGREETFLTLPPHANGGPGKVASENCDVLIIEARENESFPSVFVHLLDFTDQDKRSYFDELSLRTVMKIDDLIYDLFNEEGNTPDEFDPELFMEKLRKMPAWYNSQDENEYRHILEQFRFVECFLTSEERGLENFPRAWETGIFEFLAFESLKTSLDKHEPTLDQENVIDFHTFKPLRSFADNREPTRDREKELWRECSRIAHKWGQSMGVDTYVRYSMVPSFFLRAAMVFESRSLDLMRGFETVREIELSIQSVVIKLLERSYGNDYWSQLSHELAKLTSTVDARRQGNMNEERSIDCLTLGQFEAIIKHCWKDFNPYFRLTFWHEYKDTFQGRFREQLPHLPEGLRWYETLRNLRNRVCHPSRKPLLQKEISFLERVKDHLKAVESKMSS